VKKYLFHIRNERGDAADDEGTDLPNDDAARAHAIHGIRSLLAAELCERGEISFNGRITVADADDQELFVVPFHDAVIVRGDGGVRRMSGRRG